MTHVFQRSYPSAPKIERTAVFPVKQSIAIPAKCCYVPQKNPQFGNGAV